MYYFVIDKKLLLKLLLTLLFKPSKTFFITEIIEYLLDIPSKILNKFFPYPLVLTLFEFGE